MSITGATIGLEDIKGQNILCLLLLISVMKATVSYQIGLGISRSIFMTGRALRFYKNNSVRRDIPANLLGVTNMC